MNERNQILARLNAEREQSDREDRDVALHDLLIASADPSPVALAIQLAQSHKRQLIKVATMTRPDFDDGSVECREGVIRHKPDVLHSPRSLPEWKPPVYLATASEIEADIWQSKHRANKAQAAVKPVSRAFSLMLAKAGIAA